jgi:DNA-binding MarR family transcriptional regulator
MNQAIAVLAERGFVRRSPYEDNRRKQRIDLTESGRRVVAECSVLVDEYEQQLLHALGAKARGQLNDLLRAVVDSNRERPGRPIRTNPPE